MGYDKPGVLDYEKLMQLCREIVAASAAPDTQTPPPAPRGGRFANLDLEE